MTGLPLVYIAVRPELVPDLYLDDYLPALQGTARIRALGPTWRPAAGGGAGGNHAGRSAGDRLGYARPGRNAAGLVSGALAAAPAGPYCRQRASPGAARDAGARPAGNARQRVAGRSCGGVYSRRGPGNAPADVLMCSAGKGQLARAIFPQHARAARQRGRHRRRGIHRTAGHGPATALAVCAICCMTQRAEGLPAEAGRPDGAFPAE